MLEDLTPLVADLLGHLKSKSAASTKGSTARAARFSLHHICKSLRFKTYPPGPVLIQTPPGWFRPRPCAFTGSAIAASAIAPFSYHVSYRNLTDNSILYNRPALVDRKRKAHLLHNSAVIGSCHNSQRLTPTPHPH